MGKSFIFFKVPNTMHMTNTRESSLDTPTVSYVCYMRYIIMLNVLHRGDKIYARVLTCICK